MFDGQLSLFDQSEKHGITEDEIIKCLRSDSGFEHGAARIWKQFTSCRDRKVNAEFLKNEYGTGGMWPAYGTDKREDEVAVDYDSRGIQIMRIADRNEKIRLSWDAVERRIRALIEEEQYLKKGDRDEA